MWCIKFSRHFFSYQSLLLGTSMPNDKPTEIILYYYSLLYTITALTEVQRWEDYVLNLLSGLCLHSQPERQPNISFVYADL